jgi:hypothetical protein
MAPKGLATAAAVKPLQIPAACLSFQLFRGVRVRRMPGILKFSELHQVGNQSC